MRNINLIVVHCSDSDIAAHDNINVVRQWHIDRGFNDIGYHYFIHRNGTISIGRPLAMQGAHVKGLNKFSIGICLHGKNLFTTDQFNGLSALCKNLWALFDLTLLDTVGHYQLDGDKTCPNFDILDTLRRY